MFKGTDSRIPNLIDVKPKISGSSEDNGDGFAIVGLLFLAFVLVWVAYIFLGVGCALMLLGFGLLMGLLAALVA